MTNPYLASAVKRAYGIWSRFFLALLTRFLVGSQGLVPRRPVQCQCAARTGVGEVTRIETAFGLRVRFSIAVTSGRTVRRRDALKPLSDGRPQPARSLPRQWHERQHGRPLACHAVEAHRFPEHRPFILGVHPTVDAGVLVRVGLDPRGNHAFSNPSSPFASAVGKCGRQRWSNPTEQVL